MSELYQGHASYGNSSIQSENHLPMGAADLNSREMIKDYPRMPVYPYNTANMYCSQPTATSESAMPAPYGMHCYLFIYFFDELIRLIC